MKASRKKKRKTVIKRNLFGEIEEGLQALAAERQGMRTLRTYTVEFRKAPDLTPAQLVRLRHRLKVSRPVLEYDLSTPRRWT